MEGLRKPSESEVQVVPDLTFSDGFDPELLYDSEAAKLKHMGECLKRHFRLTGPANEVKSVCRSVDQSVKQTLRALRAKIDEISHAFGPPCESFS